MRGLQTMTSNIAAVPNIQARYSETESFITMMKTKLPRNNNHRQLETVHNTTIRFSSLCDDKKWEPSQPISNNEKNKEKAEHIPYAVAAKGRRTICFNFWLKL